jgi:hypothetical protein
VADDGIDIGGIEDIDVSMNVVFGKISIGQSIARRWMTPPGGLFYDLTYGAGILGSINATVPNEQKIAYLLQREALKDERVDNIDVVVSFNQLTGNLDILGKVLAVDGNSLDVDLQLNLLGSGTGAGSGGGGGSDILRPSQVIPDLALAEYWAGAGPSVGYTDTLLRVSQIFDLQGSRHLLPPDPANRPKVELTGGPNDRPYFSRFNTASMMQTSGMTVAENVCVLGIERRTAATGTGLWLYRWENPNNNDRVWHSTQGSPLKHDVGTSDGAITSSLQQNLTQDEWVAYLHQRTPTGYEFRMSNRSTATQAVIEDTLNMNHASAFLRWWDAASGYAVDIPYQLWFQGTLTPTQIDSINAWLHGQYGISIPT